MLLVKTNEQFDSIQHFQNDKEMLSPHGNNATGSR
jgi:hypothetical protein